jgi:hypothetical protein
MKFPQQFIPISAGGNCTDAPVISHVLLMSFRISSLCDAVRLRWNVYSASKTEFRESMGPMTGWKSSGHVFFAFFSINPVKFAIQ